MTAKGQPLELAPRAPHERTEAQRRHRDWMLSRVMRPVASGDVRPHPALRDAYEADRAARTA